MFFDDHKKIVTTIMGKRKPGGARVMDQTEVKPEIQKDEPGETDGLHAAAEDILGAHHSKSADHLKQALSNFIDLHHAQGNVPEPEESE